VWIVLVPAAALTLATLLLATLWRGVLLLLRRPAPGYVRRALRWHAGLLVAHAFATVPLALGFVGARFVGTRGDERSWRGPRIAADGRWLVQTRESLAAERERARTGTEAVAAELDAAAERRAVFLEARDGVRLRGFLVPPRAEPAAPASPAAPVAATSAAAPRFMAVLVHGLYRGGLELEPVGAMLRELGGEVFLLELRNHGGSGRARPTYGRDEALDVLAAADFLRARPEAAGRPLVVFAVSLGTAAAALAAPGIPDLAGLVLDAPLEELRATADRMLAGGRGRRGIGLVQPFRAVALWSAEHLAGVPFDEVRPIDVLARLPPDLPVLLIAAGLDERSPPDVARAILAALPAAPDRKELWLVPDAEHGKVWLTAPADYRRHLERFVARLAPSGS
jgi:hypothetical protein